MNPQFHHEVLIVGAGHAGAQSAIALRQFGFSRSLAIVGEEAELPYERPPLSKDYLAGDKPFERLLIRPEGFWAERGIELRLGRRVEEVKAAEHRVRLDDGKWLGYGTLIWATGGRPRRLGCAGADLPGVHSVRTRADVDRLAAELAGSKRVIVIGGGYIGLEAAALLVKLGKAVTLLEAQDRLLARVAGADLSAFFEREHRSRGVDLRLHTAVDCIEEAGGRACGVRLADGTRLGCDLAIVGIGIVPAVGPLLSAGATGGNGVTVDAWCRTSLTDVFAIGDCAEHPNAYADGALIRIESVQNANDQATAVGRQLTGNGEPYAALPWFWSNQYDVKLQTVGLSAGHDATILRGDPAERSFSVIYLRDRRVVALDCVNATRDYVQGRALVAARAEIDPSRLADSATPLKSLLSA